MIAGVRGRLITASFAGTELPAITGNCVAPPDTVRALEEWSTRRDAAFGPASSVRAIADGIALPLLKILGFTVRRRVDGTDCGRLEALWRGTPLVPVTVTGWDLPLDAAWRESIHEAVRADERWSFVVNGTRLRIVDAHRTWSRHYLEFDLALLAHDPDAFALLWRIGRAESLGRSPRLLDVAVDLSARHGAAICGALAGGVLDSLGLLIGALARRRPQTASPTLLLEQSLTVLYRVLFLLFAEARGLGTGLASGLSRSLHHRFDRFHASHRTPLPRGLGGD